MLGEDGAAERVDFAEGDGAVSCAFEAKAESSYAAEEIENIHGPDTDQVQLSVPGPADACWPCWLRAHAATHFNHGLGKTRPM